MSNSNSLRIILGYGLIAFVNALLPTLVTTSAYLIVPYPRPVVILIQTLPAVAAKSFLPYVLPRVPRWRWLAPFAIALCWAIATIIIHISPPNVTPWIRATGVVLVSFASGTGEVFWLGMLSLDGKKGLSGWAVGGSLGALACAGLSPILTIYMGRSLRDGLDYAWYLMLVMLGSHCLILLSRPGSMNATGGGNSKGSKKTVSFDLESSAHELQYGSLETGIMGTSSVQAQTLLRPFVMPLLLALVAQSIAIPGISRTLAVQPIFENHLYFLAAYCSVFHLGSLTARLAFFSGLAAQKKSLLIAAAIASLSLVWLALFPAATMPVLCFPSVGLLGAVIGATYVKVFDSAVEQRMHETVTDREFKLGFIGVGESLGLVVGGLAGSMLEVPLCVSSVNKGDRWCQMVR